MKDLSAELSIDRDNLDGELLRQPDLYHEAGQLHVMAVSIRDGLKEEAERVRSRVELRIRHRAKEKLTEAQIKAKVALDKDYQAAWDKYLQARANAAAAEATKDTFAQRAFVLKDLCALFIGGYFTTTSVRGTEAQGARDKSGEEARRALAERRKAGRR